jgi:hypothetical protein
MVLTRIEPSRIGFELRTFQGVNCDHVDKVIMICSRFRRVFPGILAQLSAFGWVTASALRDPIPRARQYSPESQCCQPKMVSWPEIDDRIGIARLVWDALQRSQRKRATASGDPVGEEQSSSLPRPLTPARVASRVQGELGLFRRRAGRIGPCCCARHALCTRLRPICEGQGGLIRQPAPQSPSEAFFLAAAADSQALFVGKVKSSGNAAPFSINEKCKNNCL